MNLSAEQRQRLMVLFSASVACLAASELKELDFLSGLAKESGELDEVRAEALKGRPVKVEAVEPDQGPRTKDQGPVEPTKPNILDTAKAMVSEKSQLVAANAELKKELGQLKAEQAQNAADLKAAQAQIADLTKERDELAGTLLNAQEQMKSVEESTVLQMSALGVPEAELPGKVTEAEMDAPTTKDELEIALKEAKTHREKSQLIKAYRERATAAKVNGKAKLN